MKVITFDIETTGNLTNGVFDLAKQELTVACFHDSETNEITSYLKEDLSRLWPLLERADVLVGYNSDHFDIPILNRYYSGDLTKIKSVDLLKEVKEVLGRRLRMDNLAEATLGRKKTADGMQAVRWWASGEVEKIKEYCAQDVRITRELYDYAKKNKKLKYKDYDGVREVTLNPSNWEALSDAPTMTHTLPF
jgi:DEAD/DEAH box helicase domain-containing protein